MKISLFGLLVALFATGCGDPEGQSESAQLDAPLHALHNVISIEEGAGNPRYFIEGKEVPTLNQIGKVVGSNLMKRILLRPDGTIVFSQLKEVLIQVAIGGQVEVSFDLSRTHREGRQTAAIPFSGRPSMLPQVTPMPRLEVEINEFGEILVNGALIEDGTDKEMPDLTLMLKNQREFRDQLIRSGPKTQKQAELIVSIKCDPLTEYQSLAGVFNACMNAEVEYLYPPLFGQIPPLEKPKLQPPILLKKRVRKPLPNSP